MTHSFQLNESIIRINAFITLLVALLGLILKMPFLFYFLAIDFAIRGVFYKQSLLSALSKLIAVVTRAPFNLVYAPPKYFAARIGLLFSMIIALSMQFDFILVSWITGVLLILCAVLESFFSICAGCYIYDWIFAPLKNKKEIRNKRKNETSI